jgi:rhamnosyltransferase
MPAGVAFEAEPMRRSPAPIAPCKNNTCAVVVSYFPEGNFAERLRLVQSQACQVIVVDNASPRSTTELLDKVREDFGIVLIRNDSNLGIARALNLGTAWARQQGYSWCLLFDQDTVPLAGMLDDMSHAYDEYPEKHRLAVVGSNYQEDPDTHLSRREDRTWIERKIVITSGSLVSLAALETIGPFREEFFVDCVDFDFCLRAHSKGFAVLQTTQPGMVHPIGSPTSHRFLGVRWVVRNHRPFRWYYRIRNSIVLCSEYFFKDPAWVLRAIYARIREGLLMLLFEESRAAKLKCIWAGVRDGLQGRMERKVW